MRVAGRGVAVLGAGAWGTALATAAARAGEVVRLWGRDADGMALMAAGRRNLRALPDVELPDAVTPTGRLDQALDGADLVLAAVPAQALRSLLEQGGSLLRRGTPLVICAKGIERSSGLFLSDIARDLCAPCPPAVLSGPSFAADVGRGLPTAVTIAAQDLGLAAELGARLGSSTFRLYHTDDLRGVEIGGAAKNVLAIACGAAHGSGLGASAVAALTARAFAELSRFGLALGASPETLAGLSGLGDLVLTCSSAQSRNFAFGTELGRSGRYEAAATGRTVEGIWTAPVLARLAEDAGVDMPVTTAVAAVLAGQLDVAGAVEALMGRPARAERS